MSASSRTPACLVCGGETRLCLDLGYQPLANALLTRHDEEYPAFPLGLVSCSQCSHGQLSHFVSPGNLFRNYLYASGTGQALHPYFNWFSACLSRTLRPGARVLEIACNDGSLLDSLREHGLDACGIDPAANLTDIARAKGHHVLTGFFPATQPAGMFDAIVAMNVCAHTPEPRALMMGIKKLLAPDGVAIIQTSQAFMLLNGEFDTIYHEHYSFYTPASMTRLAEASGLRIETMRIVSVHGGSLFCVLRHPDARTCHFRFEAGTPFEIPWPAPEPAIISRSLTASKAAESYQTFAQRARDTMAIAQNHVAAEQHKGKLVALVGVAAKALTFINAAGIRPDLFLDEASLKIDRYIPGTNRAVESLQAAATLPGDTVFMIGAWNFARELAAKVRALRPKITSQFIVCLPELREFN